MSQKVAWVSSWDRRCGIAEYSKTLWPVIESGLGRFGAEGVLVSLDQHSSRKALLKELARLQPRLIHFQHEYGVWGGKIPGSYWFPRLAADLSSCLPGSLKIATAHTVLPESYRYPLNGRGMEIPFRWMANRFLMPVLGKLWNPSTWSKLDCVIVHSRLQSPRGRKRLEVIPHFVPSPPRLASPWAKTAIVVFGFFTPEKGQDVAIEALALLPRSYRLILAGGLRRPKDQGYMDTCLARIRQLKLEDRVTVTGFVKEEDLDRLFEEAGLVLAPFRESAGSGSLVQALGRGAPVLTSDLPLNQELAERRPGSLAFFKTEDPKDCAAEIKRLLEDQQARAGLSQGALAYAEDFGLESTAARHLRLYQQLM